MGPIESLNELVAQRVRAIHTAAASAAPGGDASWDGLLRQYGVTPFDAGERALIVQRMGLSHGATPAEVRVILLALQRWAEAELGRLRSDPAVTTSASLGPLSERIASLAERGTSAYEQILGLPRAPAPQPAAPAAAPSVASIFANADQTSKESQWGSAKYRQVSSLTCVHCGAPQETPMDFLCRYCRRPIAE